MIRFSRKEDYAVIIITKLAENFNKRFISLTSIAKEYSISLLFLRNIANDLKSAGIITAVEGKHGGYSLKHNPKSLKMGNVLGAFSKDNVLQCCLVGSKNSKHHLYGDCPKGSSCRPGYIWRKINKDFLEKISNLTVDEFLHYK